MPLQRDNKEALNLFKTYMVLGPNYRSGVATSRKSMLPKPIVRLIMEYMQYDDWMKTANDLAVLLRRDELDFITQSESWAQDPSLIDAKKWLANPENPIITNSYDFVDKSIRPLIKFISNSSLVDDISGRTAFMWAARYDHREVLNALLAMPGIDVNMADKDGSTPLDRAAFHGHTETFKALLAAPGIDVNAGSALFWAIAFNRTEALKAMLEMPGINVHTALMMAAYHDRPECVKALLAVPSIQVNVRDDEGKTALVVAASRRSTAAVKILLVAPGIDVNAADKQGMTALMWAARNSRLDMLKALLAKPEIDLNAQNDEGSTALTLARMVYSSILVCDHIEYYKEIIQLIEQQHLKQNQTQIVRINEQPQRRNQNKCTIF